MTEDDLYLSMLQSVLLDAAKHDTDYEARYLDVLRAVAIAQRCGFAAGFRIDPQEPEWPVAYIELPTGQVSWHLPQHPVPWDGHTTDEKFDRIKAFAPESEP